MKRILIGGVVGFVIANLILASYGAWNGFYNQKDCVAEQNLQPDLDAAFWWAFAMVAYWRWLVGGIGGVIGGLAGFGSWLVRPRPIKKILTNSTQAN